MRGRHGLFLVPRVRRAIASELVQIWQTLRSGSILLVFALFLGWSALLVAAATRIGVWNVDLAKDTVFIVVGVGFPLLFRSIQAKSGTGIARRIRHETLSLSALALFYLNLESLPLWAELVVQPLIALASIFLVLASVSPIKKDTPPDWRKNDGSRSDASSGSQPCRSRNPDWFASQVSPMCPRGC